MGLLQVDIDFSQVKDFDEAMTKAPITLTRNLGMAFRKIGRGDIDRIKKEQLQGGKGLKVRFKGLMNAFKARTPNKPKDISQLYLNEHTGWEAAEIFETGGVIKPRGRLLTVLTPAARDGGGKRQVGRFTPGIKAGYIKVIRSKRGNILYVRKIATEGKKLKARGVSRSDILGYGVRRVRMKKRLDFFANFTRNSAEHDAHLDKAAEDTLVAVVKNGAK